MSATDLPDDFPVDTVAARWDRAGQLFLGLDFDGTIAPITEDPGEATLLPAAADAMEALADRSDVTLAVVSGRELADLRDRVPVDDVALAGNHGLAIDAGDRERVHDGAADAREALVAVRDAVREAHGDDPAVEVEDKGLSLAVHYRGAEDPTTDERVRATVADALAERDALEASAGKAIQEVTPAVDWDKGEAIWWLRAELAGDGAHPMYVGDDTTDEDAFDALGEAGTTVFVGGARAETGAEFRLPDPPAVAALLDRLATR